MNRQIERISLWLELLGGALLLLTACASDGGLALRPTLIRTALAMVVLGAGALGRELCSARGRDLRRRLAAWSSGLTADRPLNAHRIFICVRTRSAEGAEAAATDFHQRPARRKSFLPRGVSAETGRSSPQEAPNSAACINFLPTA